MGIVVAEGQGDYYRGHGPLQGSGYGGRLRVINGMSDIRTVLSIVRVKDTGAARACDQGAVAESGRRHGQLLPQAGATGSMMGQRRLMAV